MIFETKQFESPTAAFLLPTDYPDFYRGHEPGSKVYAHPRDYKLDMQAIQTPEMLVYKGPNSRNRLFLQTSFKLTDNYFTAATFLLDAGFGSHFQFCDELYGMMVRNGRVNQNGPFDSLVTTINDREKCLVQNDVSHNQNPANVIGLPMYFALGLKFNAEDITKMVMDKDRIVHYCVRFEPFKYL